MFPSGVWEGFWEQDGYGKQPMSQFELHFRPDGVVDGSGVDIVGEFTFSGIANPATGRIRMTKQYRRAHQVQYDGRPDGEGCVVGTWAIVPPWGHDTGGFMLRPALSKPTGDEPIHQIGG
jgi:hypothetical protein